MVRAHSTLHHGERVAINGFGLRVPALVGELVRNHPHGVNGHGVLRPPRAPLHIQRLTGIRFGLNKVTAAGRYSNEAGEHADQVRQVLRRLPAQDA